MTALIPRFFACCHEVRLVLVTLLALHATGTLAAASDPSTPSGLLFHLSANHGTTADYSAAGTAQPTFESDVTPIADGAFGPAIHCDNFQRLAWSAPGNIYSQRGTLSFFWRARDPVGPTEFPVFRVGFADHSSWDMVWLRIDYNGHGFDAFVTDASLSRTRVSVALQPFPTPSTWIHLALSWDETTGIRFYVDGKLAAKNEATGVYNVGLDQFGPHSRIISPYQVQSDYNFTRGGDIDEIRIYDHMLADDAISALAHNESPPTSTSAWVRTLADRGTGDEWSLRYGWNRRADPPPELVGAAVCIRKVEIHDAYDLKRWWWKATDGIRETTWPGVYNRSRLPGRNDYFQLPDWDCYSLSGRAITFNLPAEPWNWLEISGAAWGRITAGTGAHPELIFAREPGSERTSTKLPARRHGGELTFTNDEQEQPIGEFAVYHVATGEAPTGTHSLAFKLGPAAGADSSLESLTQFIAGRFPADERQLLVAHPSAAPAAGINLPAPRGSLPIVHMVIPDTWDHLADGLDGIALDLPPIAVAPTHGEFVAYNLRVADPLWPDRAMLDLTFRIRPNEGKTLWLDLRDRLLPPGRPLYLAIASASPDFNAQSLAATSLRLVFKAHDAALAEHELDRFTQARDAYAMLVEEHPNTPKYRLWSRFKGDLDDLLRANPHHPLGRQYLAAAVPGERPPPVTHTPPPPDIPAWAVRQTELLGHVKRFVTWYIDHRQIENGELGGGLSDDTDLTNTWPGVALMGAEPDKLATSLRGVLAACDANGMFTRGLPTIQTDELHSYEEGINCLAQNLLLDSTSPALLERAMETTRGVASITGINSAGHRHIRSSYFSGTKLATEGPWGWSKHFSYLVLHPAYLLGEYTGHREARSLVVELADGLLAHYRPGEGASGLPPAIHFATDAEGEATRTLMPWPLFWSAWLWTGNQKFLPPLVDGGLSVLSAINANVVDQLDLRADWQRRLAAREPIQALEGRRRDSRLRSAEAGFRRSTPVHLGWQLSGDKNILTRLYEQQIEQCARLEYINTEGSLWIDRVGVPYADLQRARLGGVALTRNALFPGHLISWRFAAPANEQSLAVLIPDGTPTAFKIIAFNLSAEAVQATVTGCEIAPGEWEIIQGIDSDNDDNADRDLAAPRRVTFERTVPVELSFAPRQTTVITLQRKQPGIPYAQRADLGIERSDVSRTAAGLSVKVHSLGAIATEPATLRLLAASGALISETAIPPIAAPVDLLPKTVDALLACPPDTSLLRATIEIINPPGKPEVSMRNNVVRL